jgi:hypothetical protein
MSRTSHTRAIDAATEQAHSCAPKRTRHFPPVITLKPTLLKNSKGEARMKSLRRTCIISMTLLAVAIPVQLAAQDRTQPQHQYHHYQLIDVGTFGGPQSLQYIYAPARGVLNNSGALGGWADTSTIDPLCFFDYPDCYAAHAFVWQNGAKTDLGVRRPNPRSAPPALGAAGGSRQWRMLAVAVGGRLRAARGARFEGL